MDSRSNHRNKAAFSNFSGVVFTGPQAKLKLTLTAYL